MKFKPFFAFVAAFVLCFGTNIFAQKADKQLNDVLQLVKKYDDAWNK